jgi:hypothetical protein
MFKILTSAELSSDIMVVVKDDDPKKRDILSAKIENFLYKIRNNENIRTFVHRRDEQGKTIILIGLDDHEQKDAIIKALSKRAEKEAGIQGIQIWTKSIKGMSKTAMQKDQDILSNLVRLAKELLD